MQKNRSSLEVLLLMSSLERVHSQSSLSGEVCLYSVEDLKDYMRQAGEVTYADAHKQHKNEGVVEFLPTQI